ncbi:hypothetical protein OTB20_08615 [Streptomyces sp. H27-H1]|uniref:hypothetical protein n=1 Tax=Streptomyces sp. H27-H1 TaxID=2996461 RepID=UPI0022706EC6|nr:hypothetical protein [Streptomyces sp. H27-H1]MCY0926268.1 hypothetical protein [Streptomyces sp. H27-H1]
MDETYRAQCRWAKDDYMKALRVGDSVHLDAFDEGDDGASVSLPAADARAFARGILALADEIDGGEAPPAAEATSAVDAPIKVGDDVRVLADGAEHADVLRGDVFRVARIEGAPETPRYVVDDGEGGFWYFVGESIERVVKPVPSVAPSTRAALYLEARTLAGPDASVFDVLAVAAFLTGGGER